MAVCIGLHGKGEVTVEAPCRHWERIEMPDGPVCIGKCKKCGREKAYPTTKYTDYNNDPLNDPRTTSLGRKLKRNWDEPLEWQEKVWG